MNQLLNFINNTSKFTLVQQFDMLVYNKLEYVQKLSYFAYTQLCLQLDIILLNLKLLKNEDTAFFVIRYYNRSYGVIQVVTPRRWMLCLANNRLELKFF